MIEKMKVVHVVAQASKKAEMLDALQKLGILHLSEKSSADPVLAERFSTVSRLSQELRDYASEGTDLTEDLSDTAFDEMLDGVLAAQSRKSALEAERTAALLEADRIRKWGDFDPGLIGELQENGLRFSFYQIGKKELTRLAQDESVRFIRLSSVDKTDTIAVLGDLDESYAAVKFRLPDSGLSALTARADECQKEISECETVFRNAAAYLNCYSDKLLSIQNSMEYSSVSRTVDGSDGLVWISGYIPEDDETRFCETAKAQSWAWMLQDVADDDEKVPTKIKYNKVTSLIKPVFEILGTVPGYREYDISFWFLAFFTLFFAMIIGDAGYGVIFLIAAVFLTVKAKKVTNITLLLYVLSAATIIWGAITGTWFGLEGAMKIPLLKSLVLPGFANYPEYFDMQNTVVQNNVMKFCFSIGVVQLALACIMNIRHKIGEKNLSWIADFGWLLAIGALYFVVLFLVIGQQVNLGPVATVVVAGFLLVVVFGGMSPDKTFSQGLKSGLADAFTTFLNTISAFGNVMSYIRLFAVGMASLAIAQSFNNMASGFSGPLQIVGAAIMIIGHILNIVMGLLSVVVHGVRLNLLEFSGQLGMEWSGTTYDPFCKRDKLKK